MIRIKGLTKKFGSFAAVDGLDLEVAPGRVFGFLGPNGAGKTTTIRMVCGLLLPDAGSIEVCGSDALARPEEAKAKLGFVPDKPELFPYLSARETLHFKAALHRLPASVASGRGMGLLEAFGLSAWADEPVASFSHGMKQKLALATALLPRPQALILDEPMVGLDPKGSRQIQELLRHLADSGMTVFLSIHTLEIAEKICDELAILMHGRLLAQGRVDEIKAKVGSLQGNLEEAFLKLTGEDEASLSVEGILSALSRD